MGILVEALLTVNAMSAVYFPNSDLVKSINLNSVIS